MNQLDYGYADTGDRSRVMSNFFNTVYLWVAIGLLWTAFVSAGCAMVPAMRPLMSPGVSITACLALFALSFVTNSIGMRTNTGVCIALFILYATLIGVILGPIWVVYRQATIGAAFLLTGGIFGVMSLIGYVTKSDLSRWHTIAWMCGLGLVIGSIANYWIASSAISWFVTYAIVIVFPILVMTQTNRLRQFALEHGSNGPLASRVAILGALTLYVSFINIFMSILRILGDRR
jgi:FtsH-binding integral membrane protein